MTRKYNVTVVLQEAHEVEVTADSPDAARKAVQVHVDSMEADGLLRSWLASNVCLGARLINPRYLNWQATGAVPIMEEA